jgi:hypothetical protein
MPHIFALHCTSSQHTTLLCTTMHPLLLDMYHMMQEIQAEMACSNAQFNAQLASTNACLTKLKHHN